MSDESVTPAAVPHDWRPDYDFGGFICNDCLVRGDKPHGPTCPKAKAAAPPPLDLEAIKARERAATRAPWRVAYSESSHRKGSPNCLERCRDKGEVPLRIETAPPQGRWTETECHVMHDTWVDDILSESTGDHVFCGGHDYNECGIIGADDAEFAAHARADIPALIAEVERLRSLHAAHEGKLQHRLGLSERAYERLQLCSDHRDKANGRCIVCVAEERTRRESVAEGALRALVEQWREVIARRYEDGQVAENRGHDEPMYVYRGIARGVESCATELEALLPARPALVKAARPDAPTKETVR